MIGIAAPICYAFSYNKIANPALFNLHKTGGATMSFKLDSITFKDKGAIPLACTCDGPDTSPGLHWSGAPDGTKSFALIVDDPDAPDPAAPKMTYVHWVLFNMPPNVSSLPEGVAVLPSGTREGLNDGKRTGYTGPCPPIGTHRYFFKLYALDTMLDLPGTPTKDELLGAKEGHVLAQATLMGTYVREKTPAPSA
jgi:Raf kinase inhibitor-like YbhB/YbcL family protein